MEEILVDGYELVVERFVEKTEDLSVAFHGQFPSVRHPEKPGQK
jgi:hypothetical protein